MRARTGPGHAIARVLLAGGVLAALALAPDARGAQADTGLTPVAERSFTELSGCISGEDTSEVAALFLVDESGSLQSNDPAKERVNALRSAMSSLAELSAQLESADKTVVAMGSTFAEGYTPRQPWTPVSPRGRELDDFISEVGSLDDGLATNYVAALAGARDAFRGRQDACKVLYWFTDGKLDMGFPGATQDNAEAWAAMAKPQGLVDALRAEHVTVIALPLFSTSAPDEFKASAVDKARLKALAEGVGVEGGSSERAGTLRNGAIPEGYSAGAYLESADPSVLSGYFSYAVARSSGFTDAGQFRCPSDQCPKGRLTVPVDPGITRTQVLLVSDSAPGALRLLSPTGEVVLNASPGRNARGRVADAKASVAWNGSLAKVDVTTPPKSAASGKWTLVTDPAHPSEATVLMQSGLQVALPENRPPLIAGVSTDFELSVAYPDGTPVDPNAFRDFTLTAGVGENLTPTSAASPSTYVTSVEVDGQSPRAQLSAAVEVVTRSGVALDPLRPSFTLVVSLPEGFPHVEALEFPEVQGDEQVTGSLVVVGAADAPTSFTVGSPSLTSPDGSAADALTFEDIEPGQRVELEPGQRLEVPIAFAPASATDGVASGALPVTLDSGLAGQPALTQEVPFDIAMVRPVDEAKRALWVFAFAGASLLIPLALLYVVARRLAWLRVTAGAFYLRRDAVLRAGRLESADGGPVSADPSEWSRLRQESDRTIELPGLRLRAGVRGLRPQTWAEATSPGRDLARGEQPYILSRRRGQAPADREPHEAMYLLVSDHEMRAHVQDPEGDVNVTVVVLTDVNEPGNSVEAALARLQSWSHASDVLELWSDRLPEPEKVRTRKSTRPERPVEAAAAGGSDDPPDFLSASPPEPSRAGDGPPPLWGDDPPASTRRRDDSRTSAGGRGGRPPGRDPSTDSSPTGAPPPDYF